MTSLLPAALTLSLALPAPLPPYAATVERAEPSQEHYRAHIAIDTEALREAQDETEVERQQDLFDRDVPTLFRSELEVASDRGKDTAQVNITVRWADFSDFRYGVTIEAVTPDGRKNETSFDFQGDEHDLVDRLKDEVPTVVAWLEHSEDEQPSSPEAEHDPVEGTPPSTPVPPQPDAPRLHPMGKAGIGVAAVGLAAGVTGAVLFTLTEPANMLDGGSRASGEERRFPIASIALMAVGGTALVTGIALLATDLSKSSKKTDPKTSRASLSPMLSPQGGGLSLSGRF